MALRGSTDLVHFLAGFDLAGQGAIVEVDDMMEAMTEDVTPLGPLGAIQHDAPIGRVNYTCAETGFLQSRQESLRRLLMSGAPAFPWPSILGHLGADVGALCIIATDMRIRTRSIVPSTTGITRVAIDYYLADAGDVAEDAHLLAAGVVANVVDNGATPGAVYRHDNGASSGNGATICLMADIGATLWRGYPDLRLQLRDIRTTTPATTRTSARRWTCRETTTAPWSSRLRPVRRFASTWQCGFSSTALVTRGSWKAHTSWGPRT